MLREVEPHRAKVARGEIKQKDRLEYYRRTSADAELVARQTGVSHDQAAMALEANDGDIVRAIIELTT